MQLREFLRLIESEFPAETAVEGDAIGLQIQAGRTTISSVMVTLDVTDEVVEEARRLRVDCIVTFHPLIYRPLKTITDDDRTGRLVARLIKNEIAVIAIHTNYDAHPRGTNALMSAKIDLQDCTPLVPHKNWSNFGMGVVGKLQNHLLPKELADKVSNACNAPVIFAAKNEQERISSVAIVCGSGFSYLDKVIESGVDAFITADVKYHGYLAAIEHCALISVGHYEIEQFVPSGLAQELRLLTDNAITATTALTNTNPLKYTA